MSQKQDLQKLIINHHRRLQKLKEQKALTGRATDPEILIEIEDIETELEALEANLEILAGQSETAEATENSPSPTGPWHVLVVDDDPSWQDRLKRILRRVNCLVLTASTYAEAKAELANARLDLVTIDLNLDKTTEYADGLELVSHIRHAFGLMFPIIIITGKGDLSRQRQAFKKYNVFDFIEKAKFDFEEFQAIVLEAITSS